VKRVGVVVLALVVVGCGEASRQTTTAIVTRPTFTAVVTDDARVAYDARITTALEAMAAFGAVVSRVDGANLKALGPRFRHAERTFAAALSAITTGPPPAEPALAAAHAALVASWTRLDRAMRAIASAARRDDRRAFLAADDRFIGAAAAAQKAGNAFAAAAG
jgi:hypothetical protein